MVIYSSYCSEARTFTQEDTKTESLLGAATPDNEPYEDTEETVKIKEQLEQVLNSVDNRIAGSFAISHIAPSAPNPGLFLHGVGDTIGIPLSKRDAEVLTTSSQQALDSNARNSWELTTSQFECRNPQWPAFVDALTAGIANDLGVSEVRATMKLELSKLLLYKTGESFFKRKLCVTSNLRTSWTIGD